MKGSTACFCLIILLFSCQNPAWPGEAISVSWREFDAGLAEARTSGKKVLVNVYTTWCGWCKRMDAQTFRNNAVAAYLEKHYIPVKLNAESDATVSFQGEIFTEAELAAAFDITGYPATIFLKHDGEPITIFPGYAEASSFLDVVTYIAEDHYLHTGYKEFLEGRKK
jgi:thioredoxin-related protein